MARVFSPERVCVSVPNPMTLLLLVAFPGAVASDQGDDEGLYAILAMAFFFIP